MSLSAEQKLLVQDSFRSVVPIADQAAALFYGRLFELDPSTRPLFDQTDMDKQGKMLMQMIGTAVSGLDRLEEIVPHVQALGQRHRTYGVTDEHYDTVGAALLWTLEQGLGSAFTPEVKEAWTEVYGILAKTAIEAPAN
jgi:hemoglobin-like flavoprotein